MNTMNGSLDVRIEEDTIHISVSDRDVLTRAVAELSRDQVQTLRATLEEALIRLDYPEQNKGLENDTLEQL